MEEQMERLALFRELIERSQKENRGLTIYIGGGQTIVGVVTGITEGGAAVELRSQQYHKAVVLLESVGAMAVS